MSKKAEVDGETLAGVPLTTPLKHFVFTKSKFCKMEFQKEVTHSHFTDCVFDDVTWASLANTHFRRCTFTSVSFPKNLTNLSFDECRWKNCKIPGRAMHYLKMTQCTLSTCEFDTSLFRVFRLDRCVFRQCSFGHVHMDDGTIHRTWFENCRFQHLKMTNGTLFRTKFRHCNLNMTNIGATSFSVCQFSSVKLQRAIWCGVKASETHFRQSNLTNGHWTNVEFQGCSFHSVKLHRLVAQRCQLFDVTLTRVEWTQGSLSGVDLVNLVQHDTSFQDTSWTNVTKECKRTRTGKVWFPEGKVVEVQLLPYVRGRPIPLKTPCWSKENVLAMATSRLPDFLEVVPKATWLPFSTNPHISDLVRYVELGTVPYLYCKKYVLPGGAVKEGFRHRKTLNRAHSF